MADEVTGAASAPAPQVAGFLGGFPPAPTPAPEAPPAAEAPPPPAPEPPPAPPAEKGPSLADVIRQQREARERAQTEAARAKDWESKYSEAQAEIERLRQSTDFEADPVAYAKARGWDSEKQALMGQMLLYDLVPDKAPPDLRIRLFESKQAREKREAEEKQRVEAEARVREHAEGQYNMFVSAVDQAASTFEPGSFPESEAWFGEDHDTYVRSLVATAMNLANAAQSEGKVADLSPASIARALEAEVSRRMTARDERRGKRSPAAPAAPAPQEPAQSGGGVQPTESTKGTYGSGAPVPKATTDQERVQRAIAAAFKPR
jgi:hypothetical protein